MDKKILIIENEKHIRELMRETLTKEGYQVIVTSNGEEGFNTFLTDQSINFVILDIMLSEINGWSVLKKIKKKRHIPIIMLTSRSQVYDKVFGSDICPDEYITKPFNMTILKNRIRILYNQYDQTTAEVIDQKWITLDLKNRKSYIDEEVVKLTDIEFDLLVYLVQNKNIALTRKKILSNVWGEQYIEDGKVVDHHINRLRRKMNNHGDKIKTVSGIGYTLEI